MTWAQALDDFIKFGIAPICTALVALLTVRFTRSNEDKRERRKDAQTLLREITRILCDSYIGMSDYLYFHRKLIFDKHSPSPDQLKEHVKLLDSLIQSAEKLQHNYSTLIVLGLDESLAKLEKYSEARTELQDLCKRTPPPAKSELEAKAKEVTINYTSILRDIAKAYARV